jgi:O-antigen/teichoic acid export membrane protein
MYSLGHKFGLIVNRFVTVPFNSYWNPRRMELLLSEDPEAKETVARICTYSSMVTLYFALLLSVGIKSVIEIMADEAYLEAYKVVPYVALAYVALGLETNFTAGMFYAKRTKILTLISIVGLAVVLLWNYLFVPIYGLIGAATSNLAGFLVRLVLIYKYSQSVYFIPYEVNRLVLMFIVAIALYLVTQSIELTSPYFEFMSQVAIASLFPLILLVAGFFTQGEKQQAAIYVKKISSAVGGR